MFSKLSRIGRSMISIKQSEKNIPKSPSELESRGFVPSGIFWDWKKKSNNMPRENWSGLDERRETERLDTEEFHEPET